MQYFLSENELQKMKQALVATVAVPFIDDIEDYVVESIWEFTKSINGIDPMFCTRSKKLYDVVDTERNIGWSVKSIQWSFRPGCEFELVIQRADVFKKAGELGFEHLDINSEPQLIGAALLKHWYSKVDSDAIVQNVGSKRVMILLKKNNKKNYAVLEKDIERYSPEEIRWYWTNDNKTGLQGVHRITNRKIYRWYPSQKQFFECFILPAEVQLIDIEPRRLTKNQIVDAVSVLLSCQ